MYRVNEKQLEQKTPMHFDSFYYDDFLQCRVYHKNSTAPVHQIGKIKLYLRDLVFHDASVIHPCTLVNKGTSFECGTVFLRFRYTPVSPSLFNEEWKKNVKSANQLENKFEFFNDNLANAFKDDCQFGSLRLDLTTVSLPMLAQTTEAA